MSMTLITPPAVEPVLLSEVRDFLKVDGAQEDALLARLSVAGRQACENFTGRKLIHQQWQVCFNDWQGDHHYGVLALPLSPVVSVDLLEVMGSEGWMIEAAENYLLDKTSYRSKLVSGSGVSWPQPAIDVAGIRITVTVGFGADWNGVPEDLRQGILHWIEGRYDHDSSTARQAQKSAEELWKSYKVVTL